MIDLAMGLLSSEHLCLPTSHIQNSSSYGLKLLPYTRTAARLEPEHVALQARVGELTRERKKSDTLGGGRGVRPRR
jgi:hypothetical protein